MGITRLVSLSMHYFLPYKLSVSVLDEVATTSDSKVYNLKYSNLVETKPILVRIDGAPIDSSKYDYYPSDGKVVFSETLDSQSVIAVDYHYSPINVVGTHRDDFIQPPIVAVETSGDSETGVELGTKSKWVRTEFRINLYARSEGQRDDLTDSIKVALDDSMPIWNFNDGFPVLADGRQNPSFDVTNVVGYVLFDNPVVRRNPLRSSDPIEIGRAIVTINGEYLRV